jgi:hypothetical protein
VEPEHIPPVKPAKVPTAAAMPETVPAGSVN